MLSKFDIEVWKCGDLFLSELISNFIKWFTSILLFIENMKQVKRGKHIIKMSKKKDTGETNIWPNQCDLPDSEWRLFKKVVSDLSLMIRVGFWWICVHIMNSSMDVCPKHVSVMRICQKGMLAWLISNSLVANRYVDSWREKKEELEDARWIYYCWHKQNPPEGTAVDWKREQVNRGKSSQYNKNWMSKTTYHAFWEDFHYPHALAQSFSDVT